VVMVRTATSEIDWVAVTVVFATEVAVIVAVVATATVLGAV
jgi:hypothetical protein